MKEEQAELTPFAFTGWDQDDWTKHLLDALFATKRRKAPGTDEVTNQMMRASGIGFVETLARIAVKTEATGELPFSWRGGLMKPIPKKPGTPISPEGVRGMILSSCAGKLVAKVVRAQFVQFLKKLQANTSRGACQEEAPW